MEDKNRLRLEWLIDVAIEVNEHNKAIVAAMGESLESSKRNRIELHDANVRHVHEVLECKEEIARLKADLLLVSKEVARLREANTQLRHERAKGEAARNSRTNPVFGEPYSRAMREFISAVEPGTDPEKSSL